MGNNSDGSVTRSINDVSPDAPTTSETSRRSTSKPATPRQVCKPGSGPKSITEITKLRASKNHISILPKNFQKIYKNGKLSSLIVREPTLPNNQIRKYSLIQNKRFECQRCKEVKTEQVKKNRGYVFDTKTKKIQIANYFGNDNLLFVSKKHSITCCKPFPANDSEFSNKTIDDIFSQPSTTAAPNIAIPGPSTAVVAQNIVVPKGSNQNAQTTTTTINFKPIGSASASSENSSVIKATASNSPNNPSAILQPSVISSSNETWNQLTQLLATAAADNHQTTPMEISPNVPEATTEAAAAEVTNINNITEGAENGDGEEEDDEEMNNIPPREISTGALPEITIEIIPVKAEQFSQGLTTTEQAILGAHQQQVAADENNESLKFYRPSEFKLNECCKKLNIKYDRKAYQIWAAMNNIEIIKSFSNSIKPMKNMEPMGGFQGLSVLFTGNLDAFHFINLSINKHMSERYPNISGDILFSSTITETHFAFICEFLSCRIGIYENGNLSKFGSAESWENNDRDILTILFQKVNDGINGYLPIIKV